MTTHRIKAFTLLEVIIVIIIVGVLASLALPRFFRTIEFSRSTEAFSAIQVIRGGLERCYLQSQGTYVGCTIDRLDISDPDIAPNSHFTYGASNYSATGYTITATRRTNDLGTTASTISVTQNLTTITRSGTTAFAGIQ